MFCFLSANQAFFLYFLQLAAGLKRSNNLVTSRLPALHKYFFVNAVLVMFCFLSANQAFFLYFLQLAAGLKRSNNLVTSRLPALHKYFFVNAVLVMFCFLSANQAFFLYFLQLFCWLVIVWQQNRHLRELRLGRNFSGIKPKHMKKVMDALVEVVQEEESVIFLILSAANIMLVFLLYLPSCFGRETTKGFNLWSSRWAVVFGLTLPGIKPESTVSVADAPTLISKTHV